MVTGYAHRENHRTLFEPEAETSKAFKPVGISLQGDNGAQPSESATDVISTSPESAQALVLYVSLEKRAGCYQSPLGQAQLPLLF